MYMYNVHVRAGRCACTLSFVHVHVLGTFFRLYMHVQCNVLHTNGPYAPNLF